MSNRTDVPVGTDVAVETDVLIERDITLPVLQEELDVQKSKRTTGVVRLEKTVHTYDAVVQEDLISDSISIEHVPINRYIDEPVATRQEGDTTVIPVVEEIVVIKKQLVLKEEIRLTRHRQQSRFEEAVPLRREQVNVERVAEGLVRGVVSPAATAGFAAFEESTLELTETAEEAVLLKNTRVIEEIVIGKASSERTETIRETLKHTELEVERLESSEPAGSSTEYKTQGK